MINLLLPYLYKMSENRFASIQNPEELRRLSKKELPDFATALRKEIIHALAKVE